MRAAGIAPPTAGDVGATKALAAARSSLPKEGAAYFMTMPVNGRGVYHVYFTKPAPKGAAEDELSGSVFVDPGTAKVNGVKYDNEGFTPWMYRGHVYLWQDLGLFGAFHPSR